MLTVYEKPTCTTCRKLARLLAEKGVDFERVNYIVDPLSAGELRALLAKAGLRPRDVLRTKEQAYRDLGLAERDLSDDELIDLIAAHPELLQRPIVEVGERAILARPPERVAELLAAP